MRIAITHGYFLSDSGSAIYVRELAHEMMRQGHGVTLVCQERHPEDYDFIDSAYQLEESNTCIREIYSRPVEGPGRCRMVRPDIAGRLLTYVAGPFPGFDAATFQDSPDAAIEEYVQANVAALNTILGKWPQDLVQANHMVMQPYVASEAIEDRTPYIATVHGSCLNFTVKEDRRMVPYAVQGLRQAAAVVALSDTSRKQVIDFAAVEGMEIADKCLILPPGVDTKLFAPREDRSAILREISATIDAERDDILVFVGRLLWTKGLQHVIAALPLILARRPDVQLLVAGDGPMRKPLERLIDYLDAGDLGAAGSLLAEEAELRGTGEYGPVMPEMDDNARDSYIRAAKGNLSRRIHFQGHLAHEQLAPLYAAADLSLSPSIFPEAFALVSLEAAAAGACPVATYQTGLKDPLDAVSGWLGEPMLKQLVPGGKLTTTLADTVVHILDALPTRDPEFRTRLHNQVEKQYSWKAVAERYLTIPG